MKIDACFSHHDRHGSNITNIKKGSTVKIIYDIKSICSISGLEELNAKIRELEAAKSIKKTEKSDTEKPKQINTPVKNTTTTKSEQVETVTPTKSTTTTSRSVASTPNYQQQWNNQVAQDRQNYNQALDNFSNTMSQFAENKRQERLEEMQRQEQREAEEYNRQIILMNKVNHRKDIISKFPADEIPLGSKNKTKHMYYFFYSHDNLYNENVVIYVSNVFEIGLYDDGTRAYTKTIKNEIANLTPFQEILYGYYGTAEDAQKTVNYIINEMKNTDAIIKRVNYIGKPSSSGTEIDDSDNEKNSSKYGDIIGAPAKIDPRPNNGVAPNRAVDKAKSKYGDIIK